MGFTPTVPSYGTALNTSTVTIRGTVDDPEATLRLGWTGAVIPVINGAFEVNVTLREGINNILITARDPANNSTYVSHRIILDTIPPVINVSSPVDGAVVNMANIGVSGTVTDQYIGTVTVSANNGPPQALTVAGTSFSGTVSLSSGQNVLFFEARDQAGNTDSVIRNVFLDLLQPLVSITSPATGAQVSGVIPVNVEAADIESGISSVNLLIDDQLYATTSSFPYTFELDTMTYPAGAHTLTARATDGASNQAEESIAVDILRQIQLQITSPSNGAAVSRSMILVKGVVTNNLREAGVIINGVIAQVNGDQFAAEVYLQEGLNTITATATDGSGLDVTASIDVTLTPEVSALSLTALPSSGIQPLEATLEAEGSFTNPVANYQWDIDGNGTIDASGTTLSTITNIYPNPGLYFPMVIVTDNLGNQYEATTIVNVMNHDEIDALLRGKWTSMIEALTREDLSAALSQIFSGSQASYQTMFSVLSGQLPSIIATAREFNLIDITDKVAKYKLVTMENSKTYSYEVIFIIDTDGIWKIREF